jgi:diguanylate cyclase (GGDEF)-like protein
MNHAATANTMRGETDGRGSIADNGTEVVQGEGPTGRGLAGAVGPSGGRYGRAMSRAERHRVMRLNLNDFPGSPYAAELRRPAVRLRFDNPLENEYAATHLLRVRVRVRAWMSLAALLSLLFTVDAIRRFGLSMPIGVLHLCVLDPLVTVLVWLSWSRYYERQYLSAARVGVPLLAVLIALFSALKLSHGETEQLAGLAAGVGAFFFFTGLLYRQALPTGAAILVTFAATAVVTGLPESSLFRSMAVLGLATIMSAIVCRDAEQSSRREFLEGTLIADLAAHDGLTGLMNRRAFDEHLRRVWQHGLRDQRAIAILMVDIDHFKGFNDRFGHQAGDAVLRSVADVIKGFARRPLDLAARYGGEEFALILYDLAPEHVTDIAERLRQSVQHLKVHADPSAVPFDETVTVSVGIGVAEPSIGRTPDGAVQLADEALYEAKRLGRNRVVVKGIDAYRQLRTGDFATPRAHRRRRPG